MTTSNVRGLCWSLGLCLAVACNPAKNGHSHDDDSDGGDHHDGGGEDAAVRDAAVDDAGHDAGEDGGKPSHARLSPSDLSVLFPLPASKNSTALLRLDAAALGGPLLSQTQFASIPVFQGRDVSYDAFRIVGMRVDPCFPDLSALEQNPAACRRQIRLVAQPMLEGEQGLAADDAAIHLLYDLDASAFRAVLDHLVELRGDRPIDPHEVLGVNPVLKSEGEQGKTGEALRALIVANVGPKQLKRFTFMFGNRFFSWEWGGIDVAANGALSAVAIHDIAVTADHDDKSQSIIADQGIMDIAPRTPKADALEALMGDRDCGEHPNPGCATFKLKHTAEQIHQGLKMALDIQNPSLNNPDTVDCASCHQAGPLFARAESLGASSKGLARFSSSWNLTLGNAPDLIGAPNRVRAFGYLDRDSVLAQRTVNEAAAVADAVNRLLDKP